MKGAAEWFTGRGAVSARHRRVRYSKRELAPAFDVRTPGQLYHFVALALQQNGQQSALRKSQV